MSELPFLNNSWFGMLAISALIELGNDVLSFPSLNTLYVM